MGFFSFFNKRNQNTIETPQNPCPSDDDNQALPKGLTDYLNKDKISPMNLDTFFAAVNLVSNSVAMMEWLFKDKEGNLLPDAHYLYHLFENSELTKFNIVKNVIQDMTLYGNGFIYIERDNETGRPKTLHYSPARQTNIWYNEITHKAYYQNLTYSENWDDGTNFLHFFMNSDDGFIGKGAIKYAYNVLNIAGTIQKATETYYSTTGQQFGIVTPSGDLPANLGNKQKQINELEASWNRMRNKPNKGTIFFPADLKFIPLNNTAKDSSLIESREYNAVAIGRFLYNISPVLLGDLRHNVYGTLTESQREFVIHSLAPITHMWEEQCNKKLIMPSKWNLEFVDLDENSILATDQEKQANYLNTLTNSGILSRNEARAILGYPPVDGGDALVVPYSKIEDNTIGSTENKENKQE